MIEMFRNIFGKSVKTDYAQLVTNGAIILDVRSKGEFESGHIKGSVNIPLDQLTNNLGKLKDKARPVITCCASGIRSASAKSILLKNGYEEVYNGGGWGSLQKSL